MSFIRRGTACRAQTTLEDINMFKKVLILFFVVFALTTNVQGGPKVKVSDPKVPDIERGKKKVSEPKTPRADLKGKTVTITLDTSKGKMTLKLFPDKAPLTVTNFVNLTEAKFYDGLTFHRVVPGFVIQGGDPDGNGSGGPGYTVKAEIGMPHKKHAVATARTGDQINPERRSSGSQFYITTQPTPALDGQYTVFGEVTGGNEVVDLIQVGDKIIKAEAKFE